MATTQSGFGNTDSMKVKSPFGASLGSRNDFMGYTMSNFGEALSQKSQIIRYYQKDRDRELSIPRGARQMETRSSRYSSKKISFKNTPVMSTTDLRRSVKFIAGGK